ncbi:MAG: nucleotidyl transferase AbiEii/AbiGii toxin family protein [Bacteroidales bacterium]|jgi:predicted nucleotidyltransferase component of viral defense system|nr:nucleotidyl transferase AbiEii/AbiGii toxin family protein [Bacteroidales bacterium]
MINRSEINKLAIEKQVKTSTIDKDWVLGHFVDAIFSLPECRDSLIFKGGTCLKKCRLPNYRFSEDLDFTSKSDTFRLDMPLLEKIVALVTERTEMPLYIQTIDPLFFNDRLTGYSARIKYWGADHRKDQQLLEATRWLTSIKIEIILYETMCFEPEICAVSHPYSDKLSENATSIPVYSICETLAEKIRALIQRSYTAPRDYYDIWYLSRYIENINWQEVVRAFYAKMAYKGLSFTNIDQLINPQNDKILKAAWKNSLEHQIPFGALPDYEMVRKDLVELFIRIFD